MQAIHSETLLKAVEYGILGLLVALGLSCLAVFARRWRAVGRAGEAARPWVERLAGELSGSAPIDSAAGTDSAAARISGLGLANAHLCPEALDRLLETQEGRERRDLESGSQFLGTVGANAPFLGLTGTVIGILSAFGRMAQDGGGGAQVMAAISRALIATAAGLAVAIPAVVCFNLLKARIRGTMAALAEIRGLLMARSLQAAGKDAF